MCWYTDEVTPSMQDYGQIVRAIAQDILRGQVLETRALPSGTSGPVFLVHVRRDGDGQHYVIKLSEGADEPDIGAESVASRVYGRRMTNLAGAYRILREHAVPVPSLYAYGYVEGSTSVFYQVMSMLEGISVWSW